VAIVWKSYGTTVAWRGVRGLKIEGRWVDTRRGRRGCGVCVPIDMGGRPRPLCPQAPPQEKGLLPTPYLSALPPSLRSWSLRSWSLRSWSLRSWSLRSWSLRSWSLLPDPALTLPLPAGRSPYTSQPRKPAFSTSQNKIQKSVNLLSFSLDVWLCTCYKYT